MIERAIKKATGELEGVTYEEIRYEGYAPGGVAVIVDCLTDNKVRTVADVRHAFTKFGGNMGTEGSVAFMFRKLGVLSYEAGADEDAITEAAIEAGADDVAVYDDGAIDVLTSPEAFADVKAAMEAVGLAPGFAEITMRADNDSPVDGDTAEQVKKLLAWLEDMDDVQNVVFQRRLRRFSVCPAKGGNRDRERENGPACAVCVVRTRFPVPVPGSRFRHDQIPGIDPGSQRTGVGIIDVAADGSMRHVHHQPLVLLRANRSRCACARCSTDCGRWSRSIVRTKWRSRKCSCRTTR